MLGFVTRLAPPLRNLASLTNIQAAVKPDLIASQYIFISSRPADHGAIGTGILVKPAVKNSLLSLPYPLTLSRNKRQ
jgi:hypothetical protein